MVKKPIILAILDGLGYRKEHYGNGVYLAKTPNLDKFFAENPHTLIEASGEEVGLPAGQMGNSEVGHQNIGAGRIVYQSLTYINQQVKSGEFYKNPAYLHATDHAKKYNSNLHLMGLVSDGGVHSHMEHIKALIRLAKQEGVKDVYVHAFMDGRDVDPQSGVKYIDELVALMKELNYGHIADIGGRYWGMDRDKNLIRNDRHYRLIVDHDGPSFTDYHDYFIDQYKNVLPANNLDASDEFLIPTFNANVDGRIKDNDSIIYFNFRPDRAIQISTMFTNPTFYSNPPLNADGKPAYKAYTPEHQLKNLYYVSTMKYADSVKSEIAFTLPSLANPLGPWLADHGYTQLRIAETEKYAHVTFFFDGTVNYDGVEKPELKGSRRVLINSPKVATYDLQPEMSAVEVTDALFKELDKKDLDVVILNFANCDMVGHTAVEKAIVKAVETVDAQVGRILDYVKQNGGTLILTADHGNSEQFLDAEGRPFTAHTTNPVHFSLTVPGVELMPTGGKLSNIAPTIIELLGEQAPKEMDQPSLIIKK